MKPALFDLPAESVSEPFEVLRAGSFSHPDFGSVKVSGSDLDQAQANFTAMKARGAGVPIDYDHSFRRSGNSRAAGWMESLERTGDKLIAKVKWTADAATSIRSGAYRFFSPEFVSDFKDETGTSQGFTLLAGGLTNRPFLKGMAPVSLAERIVSDDGSPESRAALDASIKEAPGSDYLDSFQETMRRSDFERQMAKANAVDADRLDLHRKAEQLADERGITYVQALDEIGEG